MHGMFSKWRTINCRILLVKTWLTSLAMLTAVQFLTATNVIDQSAFMALFIPKFAVKFDLWKFFFQTILSNKYDIFSSQVETNCKTNNLTQP